MIQELLGVGVVEDRKIPIAGGLLGVTSEPASSSSSAHSTSSSSSAAAAAAASGSSSSTSNSEQQNLRCPRCDSTNTKFCYYNNYNLTQPRHFCKTCRRYWTQGGALRNVPIGGGCRKTKSTGISLGAGKPASGSGSGIKAKPPVSDFVAGKSGFGAAGVGSAIGFDHDLPSSPILWAAPQNSHLLSLLRAAQGSGISNTNNSSPSSNPNPNPNPIRNANISPVRMKEEGPLAGSHLVPEASLLINALNARNLGLDTLGQVPLGLCNSLWRSSQYQHPLQHQHQHQQAVAALQQQQQPQQQNNCPLLGENPSSGIQELIQRLRSTNNHYTDHPTVLLGNVGSSPSSSSISFSTPTAATTTTTTILEPAPVAGGEFGCWNSTSFAWADMPNINGAFP